MILNPGAVGGGGLKLIANGVTTDTFETIELTSVPEFAVVGYDTTDGANMGWASGAVIQGARHVTIGGIMVTLVNTRLGIQNEVNVHYGSTDFELSGGARMIANPNAEHELKAVIGRYIGTGKSGQDSPNTLTFFSATHGSSDSRYNIADIIHDVVSKDAYSQCRPRTADRIEIDVVLGRKFRLVVRRYARHTTQLGRLGIHILCAAVICWRKS